MRVLVTGGTGYVGAYAVRRLLDCGHQPRLLVRAPDRLARSLAPLGVPTDSLDLVIGDMTDAEAVAAAADGAEAAIHAAAVVAALNKGDAHRTIDSNVGGTTNVLDAAIAAGCDPVVHVSSVAALFDPHAPVLTSDLPPAVDAANPYTRSKALAEQVARDRQAAGAPVVIVYPGGVAGPPAGSSHGEVAEGFVSMLKGGFLPLDEGGIGLLDVRDLAAAMEAMLRPGLGPRRFMAGGRLLSLPEVGALVRRLTGRRFPVLPTPGAVFRGLGHVVDGVRKVVPIDTVYTAEAMTLLTLIQDSDDSAVHDQLGIDYRDAAETLEALMRGLYAAGRLSARQVGRLAG